MTERAPNEVLRALRESTPSEHVPGEAMSRQELADRVAAYVRERYGQDVAIDGKYVGKLERGYVARPRMAVYREALRAVFGVGTDRELGFALVPKRADAGTNGDMDRRTLILGTVATGSLLALLRDIAPTPAPARIGRTEIEQVRAAAGWLDEVDLTHGGGVLRAASTAQVRWAARLLDASCPEALRPELFSAVGYLAHVSGFMAFDDWALNDARRLFRFALACAEESDDWHLRASALTDLGQVAAWTGDADTALTYIEQAFVRADRVSATQRAAFEAFRARTLARVGRVEEGFAAIGRSDDEFARSTPGEGPPWYSFYTEVQHLGATGATYYDLALRERGRLRPDATDRLDASVSAGAPPSARCAAFFRARGALLGLSQGGDLDQAVAHGHAAADAAATIRSQRLVRNLREIHAASAPHAARSDVADLRERLATVVAA